MSIFKRTKILVSANLHDWFDKLERPEQTARHGLRELKGAIETATAATARSIAAQRLLERRRDEQQRRIDAAHQRASAALRAGNEAAARRELVEQYDLTQTLGRLNAQIGEAETVNEQLRAQIHTMHQRCREEEDRLAMHVARHATATAARQMAATVSSVPGCESGVSDIQRALERIDREAVEAEVEAELYLEECAKPDASIESREMQQFIDDAIARLRTTAT